MSIIMNLCSLENPLKKRRHESPPPAAPHFPCCSTSCGAFSCRPFRCLYRKACIFLLLVSHVWHSLTSPALADEGGYMRGAAEEAWDRATQAVVQFLSALASARTFPGSPWLDLSAALAKLRLPSNAR